MKLTNIKILDKILCLLIVPKFLIVAWNTDSAKTFQAQNFMIYGKKQCVNQIFFGRMTF